MCIFHLYLCHGLWFDRGYRTPDDLPISSIIKFFIVSLRWVDIPLGCWS